MEGLDTSIYFFIVSPEFSRIGLRSVSYHNRINPKEKKHMDKKQKQFFGI